MRLQHLDKVLLLCSLLLAVVPARRDVANRRGFTPQAMEEMRARSLLGRATAAASERLYYTNKTKSKLLNMPRPLICLPLAFETLTVFDCRILRGIIA